MKFSSDTKSRCAIFTSWRYDTLMCSPARCRVVLQGLAADFIKKCVQLSSSPEIFEAMQVNSWGFMVKVALCGLWGMRAIIAWYMHWSPKISPESFWNLCSVDCFDVFLYHVATDNPAGFCLVLLILSCFFPRLLPLCLGRSISTASCDVQLSNTPMRFSPGPDFWLYVWPTSFEAHLFSISAIPDVRRCARHLMCASYFCAGTLSNPLLQKHKFCGLMLRKTSHVNF